MSNTKDPHTELMFQYTKEAMKTDKPWELWEFNVINNHNLIGNWGVC